MDGEFDKGSFLRAFAHIDMVRQQKIGKYASNKDVRRSLLGELFVKWKVSADFNIPLASLAYEYGPHGKPHFKNHRNIHFNISHSNDYIVSAISKDKEVGIDIEFSRDMDFRFIKSLIFDAEYAYLLDEWNTIVGDRFFKLWSLKESYCKLKGKQIGSALSEIEFGLQNEHEIQFVSRAEEPLIFKFLNLENDYALSLCSCESNIKFFLNDTYTENEIYSAFLHKIASIS